MGEATEGQAALLLEPGVQSWAGDSVQQQMGRREELATCSIAAGVYLKNVTWRWDGNHTGAYLKPCLSSSPHAPGRQVSADT